MDPELAFPDILFLAAPLFALGVALEWWLVGRGRARGRYAWRDAAASMSMGVGSLASDLFLGAASLALLMGVWEFRLLDLGAGPLTLFAAFIAGDFIYYWKNRFAHTVRWWWTAHVVHHSSTHYNLTTALRQPWNNHWTGHVLLSSPLVLLGFHPLVVGFAAALNLLYQYWIHTEAIDRMPAWFEAVFNTPSPPPGASRDGSALSRPQLRGRADCMGQAVRHFPAGGRGRDDLRHGQAGRNAQSPPHRVRRNRGSIARRGPAWPHPARADALRLRPARLEP